MFTIQSRSSFQFEPVAEGDFETLAEAKSALAELESNLGWRGLRIVDEDGVVALGNQMKTWQVTANACDFGLIEAETAQQARDIAAQDAGYKSEDDMVAQLGAPSEIVATEVTQ